MGILACIFDMDGLLIDTEHSYSIAQQNIVGRFGKTFTIGIKIKMMGKKPLDAAQILVDELDLGGQLTPQQFLAERDAMLESVFPDVEVLPGVERLIRHLHAHGIPMAVATGSSQQSFKLKTSKKGALFDLFGGKIVTGDMVCPSKPAPDIYLKAAELLGVAPENCLAFEDAPNGVESALSAGMACVHVPFPEIDPAQCLPNSERHQVINSMELIDLGRWGLPPLLSP